MAIFTHTHARTNAHKFIKVPSPISSLLFFSLVTLGTTDNLGTFHSFMDFRVKELLKNKGFVKEFEYERLKRNAMLQYVIMNNRPIYF